MRAILRSIAVVAIVLLLMERRPSGQNRKSPVNMLGVPSFQQNALAWLAPLVCW